MRIWIWLLSKLGLKGEMISSRSRPSRRSAWRKADLSQRAEDRPRRMQNDAARLPPRCALPGATPEQELHGNHSLRTQPVLLASRNMSSSSALLRTRWAAHTSAQFRHHDTREKLPDLLSLSGRVAPWIRVIADAAIFASTSLTYTTATHLPSCERTPHRPAN